MPRRPQRRLASLCDLGRCCPRSAAGEAPPATCAANTLNKSWAATTTTTDAGRELTTADDDGGGRRTEDEGRRKTNGAGKPAPPGARTPPGGGGSGGPTGYSGVGVRCCEPQSFQLPARGARAPGGGLCDAGDASQRHTRAQGIEIARAQRPGARESAPPRW